LKQYMHAEWKIKVNRDVTTCRLANSYRHFGGTAFLLNVGNCFPGDTL